MNPVDSGSTPRAPISPADRTGESGMRQAAPGRMPVGQWIMAAPRQAARALVMLYRYTLSPLIGFHCRHLPTCSEYSDEALSRHGLWAGGWMTLARLCRCHPLGTSGLDFVPASLPERCRWYAPWRYGRWRGVNDKPDQGAALRPPPAVDGPDSRG
jgi:hypothetical protein